MPSDIRLTLVTSTGTNAPQEYPATSLRDALAQFAADSFKDPADTGDPRSDGPARWVLAIIVERDGAAYSSAERLEQFRDLLAIETYRADRASVPSEADGCS